MVDHLSSPSTERPLDSRPSPPMARLTWLGVAALCVLAVGTGWLIGRAGVDEPESPTPEMLATVEEWIDAVRSQDVFRIVPLYTDDAVWHDEALDETFTGAATGWGIFGWVDEVVEVEIEAIQGDTAVIRWTFDGVTDWYATGLSVLTFDGDMIAAETVYYDCAQSPVAGRCANMR